MQDSKSGHTFTVVFFLGKSGVNRYKQVTGKFIHFGHPSVIDAGGSTVVKTDIRRPD